MASDKNDNMYSVHNNKAQEKEIKMLREKIAEVNQQNYFLKQEIEEARGIRNIDKEISAISRQITIQKTNLEEGLKNLFELYQKKLELIGEQNADKRLIELSEKKLTDAEKKMLYAE
jgi:hypothetical protein